MKHRSSWVLHKKNEHSPSYLMCRVRWDGKSVDIATGYVVDPQKWDGAQKSCTPRSFHGDRKIPSSVINAEMARYEATVDKVFTEYVRASQAPSVAQVRDDLKAALDMKAKESLSVLQLFDKFVTEQSSLNGWREATLRKMRTARRKIREFGQFCTMDDITTGNLTRYVDFLRETPIAGITEEKYLNNTSLKKQLAVLRWFLRWADKEGYASCRDFVSFRPKITVSAPPVVFLTWDELMTVWNYIPATQDMRDVQDMFLFSCFTSLRFSDVQNLRWADVRKDSIVVTTVKTDDPLTIELNQYSRQILERQKRTDSNVFPRRSNQAANRTLKSLVKLCGIDTPVRHTIYHGSAREDVVKPKYEMIGTHAGRRTFICNALMLGISPMVVMQWTGHSDYSAMKPYIAIADAAKKTAMSLFDRE